VDSHSDAGQDKDPPLSREHVLHILHRAGLDEGQIAAVLDGIEFPSPLSKIMPKAVQHGLTHADLTDRMGGSP
jgi:hypothetical protein